MPVRILLFLVCFVFTLSAEKAPFRLSSENTSFIKYLPEGFKHGWIEVPEDYAKPQGRKIHVFYCWRALDNKATPLIYFNGGPGQSMHTSYSMVLEKVAGIPIVLMDQRGTGASTSMPQLSAKNILRYRHYLSENIARDAEVLRKRLFANKKWAVTGSSFGSLISHKYMSLFPQSLTSVHAHGWALMSKPQIYPEMRLLRHQSNLERYFKKYPQDRKLYKGLRDSLGEEDVIQDKDGFQLQGKAMLDLYGFFTFGMSKYWAQSHDLLQNMCGNDGRVNKSAFRGYLHNYIFKWCHMNLKKAVLNICFNRLEGYVTGDESLSAFYEKIFLKLKAQGNDPANWAIGEEALSHFGMKHKYIQMVDEIQLGRVAQTTAVHLQRAFEVNPQIQFYLYSSELDSFTPPEAYEETVNLLGAKVKYLQFRNCGHAAYYEKELLWENIRREAGVAVKRPVPGPYEKKLIGFLNWYFSDVSALKSATFNINLIKFNPEFQSAFLKVSAKYKMKDKAVLRKLVTKYLPHYLKTYNRLTTYKVPMKKKATVK